MPKHCVAISTLNDNLGDGDRSISLWSILCKYFRRELDRFFYGNGSNIALTQIMSKAIAVCLFVTYLRCVHRIWKNSHCNNLPKYCVDIPMQNDHLGDGDRRICLWSILRKYFLEYWTPCVVSMTRFGPSVSGAHKSTDRRGNSKRFVETHPRYDTHDTKINCCKSR